MAAREQMIRYEQDSKLFSAFLMSDQIGKPIEAIASAVSLVAALTAPVSDDDGDHLKDGYYTTPSIAVVHVKNQAPSPRRAAKVHNDHRHAAAVEFGTGTARGQHTLRRAALRFGDMRTPD